MSSETIELTYDGDLLKDHKIDVSILAPALQNLGGLLSSANLEVNGDKVKSNLLINADLKANCVTISFEVVTTFIDAARQLIAQQEIQDAKTILEWIGLLGGIGIPSVVGFVLFKKKKVEVKSVQKTQIKGDNNVFINFTGSEESYVMPEEAYKLLANKNIQKNLAGIVKPAAKIDGIESVSFSGGDKKTSINKSDAEQIYDGIFSDDLNKKKRNRKCNNRSYRNL